MKRLIAWFVDNSIAANLLMWVLIVGGLVMLPLIRLEEFPSIDLRLVQVSVTYTGATPSEIEDSVCIRIEEAIEGIEGIDSAYTMAVESACLVTLDLLGDADSTRILNEVKGVVDAIDSFPLEAEKPLVTQLVLKGGAIQVAVSGDTDERTLKQIGQRIRDDIASFSGITQVSLSYTRPYEISIEVSEQSLRRHGLTLGQVADAIRESSLDLPGGSLRTEGGEILLRATGQGYRGADFAEIVVLSREDGTRVTVGEIADVVDGFRQGDLRAAFDNAPAVIIRVFRAGDEDIIEIAQNVKSYVADARSWVPDGITLTLWQDESAGLGARIEALLRNAGMGLVLVLVLLALFLRFRLALWVAIGIPVAFLGALFCFPAFDISISTLVVMAFILVLGIVVDDAIVVAERVHAHEQDGKSPRDAAVAGTQEVSVPVIFGVLTTMAAFLPLTMVPGRMGQFFAVIGITVITCLAFSLIESQLILPAHLAHRKRDKPTSNGDKPARRFTRVQAAVERWLRHVADDRYRPALTRIIEWRYTAAAIAVGGLILTGGLLTSGRVGVQFFPAVTGDRIHATLTMPQGIPMRITDEAVAQVEEAVERVRREIDGERPGRESIYRHVMTSIGSHLDRRGPPGLGAGVGGSHLAEVAIELVPSRGRGIETSEIVNRIREATGSVPDAVEVEFSADHMRVGADIGLQLLGRDLDDLRAAAAELRTALATYPGVNDIADSFRSGKQEIQLSLLPEARSLGITHRDLALQVRQAFYGEEVQRVQRGKDDLRVMVRFPEDERRSIGDLEEMRIRTASGDEVPFTRVAEASLGRGYAKIVRNGGKRSIDVTASVDRQAATPEEIVASLEAGELQTILARHPDVTYAMEGEQRERARAMEGLVRGFSLSLLMIFALLAIPLRSYLQPLLIMSAIPVGTIGAILGHLILGWDLVFFSLLGIVALAGVVVNDSLVLVECINRLRAGGMSVRDAIVGAGVTRFRAILLTSATTFVGLMPMIFTASSETIFMVPIAISLAFGIIFATPITLLLVPSGYLILDDLNEWVVRVRRGEGIWPAWNSKRAAPRPLPARPDAASVSTTPDPADLGSQQAS